MKITTFQLFRFLLQYSLSDIIRRQCIKTPRRSCEELRPWSRFSRRRYAINLQRPKFINLALRYIHDKYILAGV